MIDLFICRGIFFGSFGLFVILLGFLVWSLFRGVDVEVGGRFGLLWEKFLWMVLFIFDGDLE